MAQFAFHSHDQRQVGAKLSLQLDQYAAQLRHVGPARTCEFHDLQARGIQLHRQQLRLRFALAIKLAHAANRLYNIFDGVTNDFQEASSALT